VSRARSAGFTLIELAVVLAIVGLLLGSLMYTLSAQVERRDQEETRRRLEQAREMLLTYAMVNGRLPCPARSAATASPSTVAGDEVRDSSGNCTGDSISDYYGGTNGAVTLGLLPARTIGWSHLDSSGLAIDAWNNRIRYAVANLVANCSGTPTTPHFTNATNLRANGISCQPNDLLICKSATGITSTTCGGASNQLMSQSLVGAIVWSTGKNGSSSTSGLDEAANLNGDRVYVWHVPSTSEAANGEFDDQMAWITVPELYGRLISAGMLP
jgi:prepilin-type N-terminal cleavage/methylation domain-containing protein